MPLENLTAIRDRVRLRRSQRDGLHSWASHHLRSFLSYKAQLAGVPLVAVDPRYTSQTCSVCGHREKANRVSQSSFLCKSCGYAAHADYNAAVNIGRAAVNPPHVSEPPARSGDPSGTSRQL